ncbi:MAG: histidine phosphatase family protein [Sciscionella sp.]|nr:histidine phosphatase family protein [Sciscionella sp.]
MRLYLVRHGQSTANVHRALDSLPPGPPLTELGEQQARDLAQRLATEPVIAVYASVATRARQTAEPVAEKHGLELRVIEGVHEVFVGELEGRDDVDAHTRFGEVYRRWADGEWHARMPGGESAHDLLDRFLPALQGITRQHENADEGSDELSRDQQLDQQKHRAVVLISHGAAIRLVGMRLAANVDAAHWWSTPLPNTGQVLLRRDVTEKTGWHCLQWTGMKLT